MITTVFYILFILAFIVHDGEEVAVQHKWVVMMLANLAFAHWLGMKNSK